MAVRVYNATDLAGRDIGVNGRESHDWLALSGVEFLLAANKSPIARGIDWDTESRSEIGFGYEVSDGGFGSSYVVFVFLGVATSVDEGVACFLCCDDPSVPVVNEGFELVDKALALAGFEIVDQGRETGTGDSPSVGLNTYLLPVSEGALMLHKWNGGEVCMHEAGDNCVISQVQLVGNNLEIEQ